MSFARVSLGRDAEERVYALTLLLAVLVIVPLALASPADPVWIAGFYDAGDPDEVEAVATEMFAITAPGDIGFMPAKLVLTVAGAVLPPAATLPPAAPLLRLGARAPPRANALESA
jgi:hypothetical protein